MKKTVIVKKPKVHRIGVGVLFGLMTALITGCVLYLGTAAAVLLYAPLLLIAVPVISYYFTWQIRFSQHEIVRKVFLKRKSYLYSQLREAVKSYRVSERRPCVRMVFADGETLVFRMDDENAAQAVKELQRHRSIKTTT